MLKEKGQSLTEYMILVALIVVASIGVVEILGATLRQKIAVATAKLQDKEVPAADALEEVREKHYRKRTLKDFWKTNE